MDSEKKNDDEKDCNSSCLESKKKNQRKYHPEDINFDILTRVPAEWLLKSVRFTCRSWAAMIRMSDFVEVHLLRAKPIIFLQSTLHPFGAHCLEVKGNGEYGVTALGLNFPGE